MKLTACFLSPIDYFSQHLGEYLNVLSALESLNIAILKAMDKTKEVRFHREYITTSISGIWQHQSYVVNHLVLCEFCLNSIQSKTHAE